MKRDEERVREGEGEQAGYRVRAKGKHVVTMPSMFVRQQSV